MITNLDSLIKTNQRGARDETVIVIQNRHVGPISNPGLNVLHFT